jgi:hypothetical protein
MTAPFPIVGNAYLPYPISPHPSIVILGAAKDLRGSEPVLSLS